MNNVFMIKQAIGELLALYAHYADTRQAEKQAGLFVPDAVVNVFFSSDTDKPTQQITKPSELIEGFQALKQYQQTFHFNGQSILTIESNGNHATGETYNLAHHIKLIDGERMIMVMAILYKDKFVQLNGQWFFKQRNLYVQWVDTHALNELPI